MKQISISDYFIKITKNYIALQALFVTLLAIYDYPHIISRKVLIWNKYDVSISQLSLTHSLITHSYLKYINIKL